MSYVFKLKPLAFALAMVPVQGVWAADAGTSSKEVILEEVHVTATAREELKQAPGVSTITSEDLEKRPPANDLSEIVRTMPGVNLTASGASGSRGNNRQIDLRGMGPENTLILIDGKPVTSRNSVRYARSGERDTRGDSNWVPAEQVESIEVIRGPAAARYGSGAAGGVVNIITKGVPKETHGSMTVYTNQPENSEEGDTKRVNFSLSGPISEEWGYRVYGNLNKTDSDSPDINVDHTVPSTTSTAAGREGVKNQDFNGLLRWKPSAQNSFDLNLAYSRQGNIYAGDTSTGASATSTSTSIPAAYLGEETNTMTRYMSSLAHKGVLSFGNIDSYIQYERTDNRRLADGLTGGTEGNINSTSKYTSQLDSYTAHSEINMPLSIGAPQMLTAGVEFNQQKLNDPASILMAQAISGVPGLADAVTDRSTKTDAAMMSAFLEDNIEIGRDWIVTPGLRADQHSDFGLNWSPSLNVSYTAMQGLTFKGGIARAFKAPNLYQANPNYLLYSSGNGCNKTLANTVRCYLQGNDDLAPEISINKEIGVNYTKNGWNAGITWFRNDYSSKIVGGTTLVGVVTVSGQERYVYRWENATDAVVEGLEGNVLVPLLPNLNWKNNFTYMLKNDDQNGQPLTVIPEYTINTTLDWQASKALSLALTGTFYGKQEPRTVTYNTAVAQTGDALNIVNPYSIWGVNAGYSFTKNWKGRMGVSNILNKRLFREGNSSTAGAATYNEPGRAYYASVTASF